MPNEIRHIIFTSDEVIRALIDYHRRAGNPLPAGNVVKCTFEKEDNLIKASLHMAVDADGSRQVVPVVQTTLAAALILYCINQKIPLPAKANKSLQLHNDTVGLVINKPDERKNR